MGKLMDFITEKMTDDKGFFQGGEGGRVFGRAKDLLGIEDADYNTRQLKAFKEAGGDPNAKRYQPKKYALGAYDRANPRSGYTLEEEKATLLNNIFKGAQIHSGGETRAMTFSDLGFEGDVINDPTRWGELIGFGSTEGGGGHWLKERIGSMYEGENFDEMWNQYGVPFALTDKEKSSLYREGKKTGMIVGDVLSGYDTFNIQDITARIGLDPTGSMEEGLAHYLEDLDKGWYDYEYQIDPRSGRSIKYDKEGKYHAIPQGPWQDATADPDSRYSHASLAADTTYNKSDPQYVVENLEDVWEEDQTKIGKFSQRHLEEDLRRAGIDVKDSRIENVGY